MDTVGDWVNWLGRRYPVSWAEPWDNPGLQVGDPSSQVRKVAVALDPTPGVIREAVTAGAQLLVCHHPLVFRPLERIDVTSAIGRTVADAITGGLSVVACHTNADVASPGVSDALAAALDVEVEGPLRVTHAGGQVKLTTFVPPEAAAAVRDAVASAGGGRIGDYDVCSFRTSGVGSFLPSADADPAVGVLGEINEVGEERLEMVVPRELTASAVSAVAAAHPYEEPAVDLVALESGDPSVGLGRVGAFATAMDAGDLLERCRERLGGSPRMVGDVGAPVSRIALCGGSGASLIDDAARAGADALVTGDVKHHDALAALDAGLVVIDAGHHATEWPFVPHLAALLGSQSPDVEVTVCQTSSDPFVGASS